MSFTRPTLSALVTRIRADFKGRLGISGSMLRKAMADVLANVWAGSVHMTHGHLTWVAEQLFGDTAEHDFLVRLASVYGITLTPAEFATGTVEATGANGASISAGEILVRDDGATYETTTGGTISGGVLSLSVQAVLAGADGDLDVGEILSLESPVMGFDADMTVETGGISGGVDEESTEELRARYLLRRREPPEGGSDQDYEAWALAVAGVTRAWVYRHENGLGTLVVRFVRDGETPILPDAGEVTTMQTALDAERPTTAEVTAAAPTAPGTAFTISVTPDTAAIRTAVEAELADMMFREGEPGDGVSRGTIYLSHIRTAIGVAEGADDYTLTVPVADVVPALGELPTVGTVTWV